MLVLGVRLREGVGWENSSEPLVESFAEVGVNCCDKLRAGLLVVAPGEQIGGGGPSLTGWPPRLIDIVPKYGITDSALPEQWSSRSGAPPVLPLNLPIIFSSTC